MLTVGVSRNFSWYLNALEIWKIIFCENMEKMSTSINLLTEEKNKYTTQQNSWNFPKYCVK